MSTKDYDALVVEARRGAYVIWIAMESREVEVSYRPTDSRETAVLEAGLVQRSMLVVTIDSGVLIRGVRLK